MKKNLLIPLLVIFLISCSEREQYKLDSRDDLNEVTESEVFEINLAGELKKRDSELSGLAWYNNNLILLPQFPYKFGDGLYGVIYYLPKEKIKRTVSSNSTLPLTPAKIQLDAAGLDRFNWWGSGYEGIIFNGNKVYFVIENFKEKTEGFIVKGDIDFPNKKIKLDSKTLTKINIPGRLQNLAEEAITVFNNDLYVLHEVNSLNINPNPIAMILSDDLKIQTPIGFPTIEYRITDATAVEQDSTFWVINYLWAGDIGKLKPKNDYYFNNYGVGHTHKNKYSVERLIKLKITPSGIMPAPNPPIYLKLEEKMNSRNWEGLAKLDEIGFLIVTDKFPKTILGFVRNPQ